MKKKIILILTFIIIFTLALVLIINYKDNTKKSFKLKAKDALAIMVYDEAKEDYVQSSTFPIGNYELDSERSYCKNGSSIKSYNRKTGTVTTTMSSADECYLYFKVLVMAADTISDLTGTTGTDGSGNEWGVVEDHGIRYIGQNPSNWVWFNCSDLTNQNATNCERWRIIGVFNEKYDTNNDGIPDTEGNLVKIIRNDSLGTYAWDYKQSGADASTAPYTWVYGINDWSASQLMMMLNPPAFINSGYVNEDDASPVNSLTIEHYCSSCYYTVSNTRHVIFRNMGSYFDSDLTAYKPYPTYYNYDYGEDSSGSSVSETNLLADSSIFKRMNSMSQPMIATVKWHLTGTSEYKSIPSVFYNTERDINDAGTVYTGRPKIWYGKIGQMYLSDYGYATNGTLSTSENGVVLTRDECLTHEIYNWRINNTSTSYYNCAVTDWLLYAGATGNTSATKGTATTQWTITPYPGNTIYVYQIESSGGIDHFVYPKNSCNVRSVLYLEHNVFISGGSGTYDSPFTLQMS